MHIPDGFLSTGVWITLWAVSAAALGYAIRKTNKKLGEKTVPLTGMLAAFIFAGQVLNIPVAGGTSGHMLGAVLAAVFVGPLTASIIMATVFIVQALIFQDGGVTALGANIFNMGLIGAVFGYYIYCILWKIIGDGKGRLFAAGFAAWVSVVLGSAACALELAFSGTMPLEIVLPAMVSIHALIGLIDAGVTIVVLSFVLKTRKDLLELPKI